MKLIAIDLDGTLLSDDNKISKENIEAIHTTQRQGHIVVISSGRSLHDTRHILDEADVECPIITGNGAIIFHSNQVLEKLSLSLFILSEMIDILEKLGLYYEIYTNEGIFIMENGKEILHHEIKSLGKFPNDLTEYKVKIDRQYSQNYLTHVSTFRDIDFTVLDPYKIYAFSFDEKKLDKFGKILEGRKDISITSGGYETLEIGNPRASKGNALVMLADHLDVALENVVAIGDNLNDLSMFHIAGMSIAMENARKLVKESADYITKHHNNNGVAYALKEYVLN